MQVQKLQHRHGGTITELTHIRHETTGGQSYWEFVGGVKWDDGSFSPAAHISPVCLCRDQEDADACAELDAAMSAMNDYLSRNGKWSDRGRGGWKPKSKRGQEALA